MPTQQEPKWEVVDELPGEKKKKNARRDPLSSLLRSKMLWIGVAVGVVAVVIFPILRGLIPNLVRSWWIWVGILGVWYWRRMQRMPKKK